MPIPIDPSPDAQVSLYASIFFPDVPIHPSFKVIWGSMTLFGDSTAGEQLKKQKMADALAFIAL